MRLFFLGAALTLFFLAGCTPQEPDLYPKFCGTSTDGECSNDIDCVTTGCSGQICASKSDGNMMTTCEFKDCYDFTKYSAKCGCASGTCQWRHA